MKALLSILIMLLFNLVVHAQARGTYGFADGTPDAVVLRWDAFDPGGATVEGCNVYRRTHFEEPFVKLNDELIVSADSNFVFVDTSGGFHPEAAPLYVFELIAGDLIDEVNSCVAFTTLDFELSQNNQVIFNAFAWNPDQCCVDVSVWLNGSFQGFLDYSPDEGFEYVFDLEEFTEKDHILFVFNSFWGYYQEQGITGTYLHRLADPVFVPESSRRKTELQISPNPVVADALISFKLTESEFVKLAVYSNDGRLVELLHSGGLPAGAHDFRWNTSGFAKGNYLVLLTTANQTFSKQIMIL